MKNLFFGMAVVTMTACYTAKVSVSPDFTKESTRMPVKGVNGWKLNQKLSFGNYHTSKITRGWDFTASLHYTKFGIRPEEALLRVFDISIDKQTNTQKGKFQFTLEENNMLTEMYATEKSTEKQLVYKSTNPWIGNASKTHRYEYAFTAMILPVTLKDKEPWSVVLMNKYDTRKDTARKLFDKPYVEEEGYATNGKENIAIRILRIDKVTTKSGKESSVVGGNLFGGYELHSDGQLVGIVDILENSIWIKNSVDADKKMIIASVSSAILLKRLQDPEKDAQHFDQ